MHSVRQCTTKIMLLRILYKKRNLSSMFVLDSALNTKQILITSREESREPFFFFWFLFRRGKGFSEKEEGGEMWHYGLAPPFSNHHLHSPGILFPTCYFCSLI